MVGDICECAADPDAIAADRLECAADADAIAADESIGGSVT